jgi:hypothetical protein
MESDILKGGNRFEWNTKTPAFTVIEPPSSVYVYIYIYTYIHTNTHMHIVTIYVCDYGRGMDWILDLLTPLRTTSNYSASAYLHTLEFTTAPPKPFPACYVVNRRSLATASNSGDSLASRAQVLLSQPPVQNSCQFPQLSSTAEFLLSYSQQRVSQIYFTTGGLPQISSFWCQAHRDPRPIFFSSWTLAIIVLM